MTEVWKSIEGYEGLYEVSSLGRVRSLVFHNNQTTFERTKIMSTTDNGHGYMIVGLSDGVRRRNHYVHRLVAKAFIPNPDNLSVIDHIDHNRSNNAATNLQWMAQRDNVRRSRHLMSKPRRPMTNTGERYISKLKNGRFRVSLPSKHYWRSFESLEEAVEARDAII